MTAPLRTSVPGPARRTRRAAGSPLLAPAHLVAVLLALLAAGCSRGPGGPGGRGFTMPPMPVEVADATPRTVRDQFRALGSVQSDEIIEVVSELNAVVRALPFAEGQAVAEGEVLAQLDDREIRAEWERAEARRDQARLNFQRAEKLFESQAASQQDLDEAQTALRVADADAAFQRARLDKTRIRAPFPGLIGRRRVSTGAYLRSGDVITDLARVDEMKVAFNAPERYAGQLRPGIVVEVTVPAYPDLRFPGRLTVVDPIVNPDTRTVALLARIPNPRRQLRPGMSADVAVTLSQRTSALTVPDEAVFAEGNQSFVYRVKADSTVTKSAVTLGTRDSARVEITAGLEPGATVVRAGHQKLFEGARVMPMSAAMMGGGPGGPGGAGGPGGGRPGAGGTGGGR